MEASLSMAWSVQSSWLISSVFNGQESMLELKLLEPISPWLGLMIAWSCLCSSTVPQPTAKCWMGLLFRKSMDSPNHMDLCIASDLIFHKIPAQQPQSNCRCPFFAMMLLATAEEQHSDFRWPYPQKYWRNHGKDLTFHVMIYSIVWKTNL